MSRRVFVVGGGLAPGCDGGSCSGGSSVGDGKGGSKSCGGAGNTPPVKINTCSGAGCPGGFRGANYRLSPYEATVKYKGSLEKSCSGAGKNADPKLNEEQRIQILKNMSSEDRTNTAKSVGCGGRRARREGIYKDIKDPPNKEEIAKWEFRERMLKAAGIKEKDDKPPPEVAVDDWKQVVASFDSI